MDEKQFQELMKAFVVLDRHVARLGLIVGRFITVIYILIMLGIAVAACNFVLGPTVRF